ncbi:MAG: tryptophan 2,3-dioxygenase [Acidimicrobiales bacterium]
MTTVPDPPAHDLTYGRYLRLEELLSLQTPQSTPVEPDELLFIFIHQVYELWFKEVLHELDQLVELLDTDQPDLSGHQLKRVLKIFKTLVAQLDVLETMTPLEFDSFRSFLASSSGFQSVQFRELEFLLGLKSPLHLERLAGEPSGPRLVRRYRSPSLWDAFMGYLARLGYPVPVEILDRDVTLPTPSSPEVQDVLVTVYREDRGPARLCESLTDLDEGLQEWRYRHVMMVQRTIGTKRGTGGSEGVEYLRSTLFRPAFPDLWTVRSRF